MRDGNDADVKWPAAGFACCVRDVNGGEFGSSVGVDRPLPVKRKRKKRESV